MEFRAFQLRSCILLRSRRGMPQWSRKASLLASKIGRSCSGFTGRTSNPGGMRGFGEGFAQVAHHVGFIPGRLVSAAFQQGDQVFFRVERFDLEEFRCLFRVTGGDFPRPRFPGLPHRRSNAFATPVRVQEAEGMVQADAIQQDRPTRCGRKRSPVRPLRRRACRSAGRSFPGDGRCGRYRPPWCCVPRHPRPCRRRSAPPCAGNPSRRGSGGRSARGWKERWGGNSFVHRASFFFCFFCSFCSNFCQSSRKMPM